MTSYAVRIRVELAVCEHVDSVSIWSCGCVSASLARSRCRQRYLQSQRFLSSI